MKPKTYYLATLTLFIIVGALHLIRIFSNWDLVLAGYSVPMSVSWIAVIVLGLLAYHGYTLEQK